MRRIFRILLAVFFAFCVMSGGAALACGDFEIGDGACGDPACPEDTDYDLKKNSKTGYLLFAMFGRDTDPVSNENEAYKQNWFDTETCRNLAGKYRAYLDELLRKNGFGAYKIQPDMEERYAKLLVYYNGSERCFSNTPVQAALFLDAVAANKDARQYLPDFVMARHDLMIACRVEKIKDDDKNALRARIDELTKKPGAEDFASYLKAAFDFYFYNDSSAKSEFKRLSTSSLDAWIRETSMYMYARTLFAEAQAGWDGYFFYGDGAAKLDQVLLLEAEKAFEKYAMRYPNGRYAESARNIKRRLFLFTNRKSELDKSIIDVFKKAGDKGDIKELFSLGRHEVDRYIDYSVMDFSWDAPVFATAMLFSGETLPKGYSGGIEEQKTRFSRYPGLYELARARILFLENKDAELVKAFELKDDASYGPFRDAINLMKAISLERQGKKNEAREILLALSEKGAYKYISLELLAASHSVNNDIKTIGRSELITHGDKGPDAAVSRKRLLNLVLRKAATNEELNEVISDVKSAKEARDLALQVLLERLLLDGNLKDFLKIYRQSGKPAYFEPVETAAVTLLANPNDPKGLLNYGYFIQSKELMPMVVYGAEGSTDTLRYKTYVKVKEDNSISRLSEPPKGLRDPLYYYLEGLKGFEGEEKDDTEAKILYHAIHCFRNYERRECSWTEGREINEPVRKAWFDKLKSKYGNTTWAEKTKYYW